MYTEGFWVGYGGGVAETVRLMRILRVVGMGFFLDILRVMTQKVMWINRGRLGRVQRLSRGLSCHLKPLA